MMFSNRETPGASFLWTRGEVRLNFPVGVVVYDDMFAWLKRHALAFLVLLLALSLVPAYLRAYTVAGGSEIPTVLLGDKIIVNHAAYSLKVPYGSTKLWRTGSPKRGDFVFLRIPNYARLRGVFFKRIVGLPGETVELRENRVLIDGRALPVTPLHLADFAWVPRTRPIGSTVEDENGHWATFTPGKSQCRNYGPARLERGQYFLLGDNRDDSLDSRAFGPVAEEYFLGKVVVILPTGPRLR